MKQKQWHPVLIAAVALLLVTNMYLYRQNRNYQSHNRQLILQNDSVLSINLELLHKSSRPPTIAGAKWPIKTF